MNIHECASYANKNICIFDHGMKGMFVWFEAKYLCHLQMASSPNYIFSQGKVTKTQLNITKAKRSALSQQVTTRQQ